MPREVRELQRPTAQDPPPQSIAPARRAEAARGPVSSLSVHEKGERRATVHRQHRLCLAVGSSSGGWSRSQMAVAVVGMDRHCGRFPVGRCIVVSCASPPIKRLHFWGCYWIELWQRLFRR